MSTNRNPALGGAPGTVSIAAEFVLPIVANSLRHSGQPLKISDRADEWIEARADDLARGRLSLPELPRALRTLYFAGFADGEQSRQAEVDQLNYEADRLYTEMSRRAPVPMIDPNRPTYAELERRRGNHEHAEQVEAANAARFAEVTS